CEIARPAASSLALLMRMPEDRRCRLVARSAPDADRLRCALSDITLVLMTVDIMVLLGGWVRRRREAAPVLRRVLTGTVLAAAGMGIGAVVSSFSARGHPIAKNRYMRSNSDRPCTRSMVFCAASIAARCSARRLAASATSTS